MILLFDFAADCHKFTVQATSGVDGRCLIWHDVMACVGKRITLCLLVIASCPIQLTFRLSTVARRLPLAMVALGIQLKS